ncbi:MAG TPA: hypothetical protein VND93_02550, partial [Myxococcales bacterium]|nr:hypothetical protein [Myxococcales bacterium]
METTFADRLPSAPAFALCFAAFQLAMLGMGAGAALLLLPRGGRRDALAFAPVLGLVVATFAGWHLMFAGPPGTDRHWGWPAALGAALTLAGCAWRRRELRQAVDRDVLWLAAAATLTVCFYAHATLREPHLTAAAQNNDIAAYTAIERQLQALPGTTPKGPGDQFGMVDLARTTVTGAFLGTALFSSAIRVPTYQLQTVSIAAYLSWGALLAGLFALRVLRFSRGGALLVTLVAGAGQVTLYTAWCSFKSSLAGTAVMMAVLVAAFPVLQPPRPAEPPEPRLARVPLLAALALGLALAYPHQLPILWAVLGAAGCAHAVVQRSWAPIRNGAVALGGGLLAAAAVSPGRAAVVASYFSEMGQS